MWELKRSFLGVGLTLLFLLIRLGKYYDLFFVMDNRPSFKFTQFSLVPMNEFGKELFVY